MTDSKMNVVRVFKSDSDEVFFEHDNPFKDRDYLDVIAVIREARKQYNAGNYLECTSEIDEDMNVRSYFYDDEFLGDKGMHIRTGFHPLQHFIFLESDDEYSIEKMVKEFEADAKNRVARNEAFKERKEAEREE